MAEAQPPYLLSPFVLAELDYLLLTRVGIQAQTALLREVEQSAFRLEAFDHADVGQARELVEKFHDQEIGLADASIVVLSQRYSCHRVLTLDLRHFRVLPAAGARPFEIFPADAR